MPTDSSPWTTDLHQALKDLQDHPDALDASQKKDRLRPQIVSLGRWLAEHPDKPPPCPDGRNLLCDLAKIDPLLSLQWWEHLQERAWEPSARTPGPVTEWVVEMAQYTPPDEATAHKIRAAVDQGLRVGMPMRQDETREMKQWEWEERAILQEHLVRVAVGGKTGWVTGEQGAIGWAPAGWLFDKIKEHGGALLFTYMMIGRFSTDCPNLTPRTRISQWKRKAEPRTLEHGTWLDFFFKQRDPSKEAPSYLAPWLQAHGVDPLPVMDRILAGRIQAAVDANEGKERRWLEVLTLLEKGPMVDCNTGLPFFFFALQADRSLLAQAIKRPPPGGLHAQGSLGETVWDSLLFPDSTSLDLPNPSAGAIKALLEAVPLKCRSSQGFLWRAQRAPWTIELAQKTLHSHLDVWLGDCQAAKQGALQTLVMLATAPLHEHQVNALYVFEHLFRIEASDPSVLDPHIKDIMRAAHELLREHPEVKIKGKERLLGRYRAPQPQGTRWHEGLEPALEVRRLNPPSTLPGTDLLEQHLLSIAHREWLEGVLPAPQAGPSPKPGARPMRL